MIYENDVVRDVQIAYIGGGSRGWARTFMTDLAMEPRMGGTIRLYDIDTEAAKANETIGNHLSQRILLLSPFFPEPLTRWRWMFICRSVLESASPWVIRLGREV